MGTNEERNRSSSEPESRRRPIARWVGLVFLLGAFALSASIRINGFLGDPNLKRIGAEHPEGLMKSDPGLLYYITERIVDGGGLPPDDFRADPRIQHPDLVDIPAMFTVGQEFLVAWGYRLFGGDLPLHIFAVYLMSIIASLAVVGVYGLSWELTRKVEWAVLATWLYVFLPFTYRTVGLVLIREELSFPLFALHLWLLARASRVRTRWSFLWAALPLAAALATWHMMGFIVTIEAVVFLAWFLRSGENPMSIRGTWILPGLLLVASFIVPVLWAKLFLLSFPMQIAAVLMVLSRLRGSSDWTMPRRIVFGVGGWVVALLLGVGLSRLLPGGGDYSHVIELVTAKLTHLGGLPDDPDELSFGARLLWQGPFATATAQVFWIGLGLPGLVGLALGIGAGVPDWVKGRTSGVAILSGAALISIVAAWLIQRTMILLALQAPVLAVLALARWRTARSGMIVMGLTIVGQGTFFLGAVGGVAQPWYVSPVRIQEIRLLTHWIEKNVPPEEAILGDFMVGTSILAHSKHRIICQPKYETRSSRDRIEKLYTTFHHGTPEDFRRLALSYDCRYVVIDRMKLWIGARYIAGVPLSQKRPDPGTAAWSMVNKKAQVLNNVPGFELVYRSPEQKLGTDDFRVFRVK
jgi:hypothetical protein